MYRNSIVAPMPVPCAPTMHRKSDDERLALIASLKGLMAQRVPDSVLRGPANTVTAYLAAREVAAGLLLRRKPSISELDTALTTLRGFK